MLIHPTEPRVIAVLDWELSTIGHPLGDLGFAGMPFHTAPDEYGGILGAGTEGIPTEAEFFEASREVLPEVPSPQPFHIAFALFRFAGIFVGIADRAASGTAADPEAAPTPRSQPALPIAPGRCWARRSRRHHKSKSRTNRLSHLDKSPPLLDMSCINS